MGGTSLKDVQLDRSYLAAEPFLDRDLKRLSGSGEIFVTESIGNAALSRFADICSVGKPDTLGNRDNDVRMPFKCRRDVGEEFLVIKHSFGKVDKIGLDTGDPCQRRRSRQAIPRRVPLSQRS